MRTLLTLTLSGSLLTLLLLALRYVVLRRMPSSVYYYAWLLVLLRFALPLPGLIPGGPRTEAPAPAAYRETRLPDREEGIPAFLPPENNPSGVPAAPSVSPVSLPGSPVSESEEPSVKPPQTKTGIVSFWRSPKLWLWVWAAGTAVSFGLTAAAYGGFTLPLRRELRRPDRFTRKIYASLPGRKPGLFVADTIHTPLMFGLFSPRIVLPERAYEEELLLNILRHELMHYRRFDTLYKWAAAAVLSAHWFNPLSWLIRRELNRACELSCDEMLLRTMTREEKQSYGHTLLSMAASALPAGVIATTFATEKRNLKERLEQIMHYKKSKARLLAAVLALALLAGCGLAAGPRTEKSEEEPMIPEGAVHVRNVDEFLAAIGSNTTIYLEAGEYDLSQASDYGRDTHSPFYSWNQVWDEGSQTSAELLIQGVENLTILGAGRERTTIAAVPRYANVLRFVGCSGLNLQDLTAGHTREPGFCSGGVLRIEYGTGISIRECGLYGCGTVGVDAADTNSLTVTGCDIYECSMNAVALSQCYHVQVEDCEIYRHGVRAGESSAMALFTAAYSHDVTIRRNRIHDNAAQSLLQLRYTSAAAFLSNEVRSNRFDSAVFQFEQYGATVDGCAFIDNGPVRGWVQSSGVYANDITGKLLDAEDFENMELRELEAVPAATPLPVSPAADVRPGGEITVTTVDEFLAAIGPDRTIVLDGELFDLSEASNYGSIGGEYYYWQTCYDGPELVIHDVSGLTIHPKASFPEATTLSAVPRYANVLRFENCDDLMLIAFTAGHTKEPGACSGGVLHFQDCRNVRLEGMRLYGCGILGIQASRCTQMNVLRGEIYECSQGAAQFHQCDELRFEDCHIHDISAPAFVFRECSDVSWNGESVTGLGTEYNVDADGSLSPGVSEFPDNQSPNALSSFTFADDSAELAFMASVQEIIADGDWEKLADEVYYPLQVLGEDYFVRILDREQLLEAADSLFTPDFRETVAGAPLDEFGGTIYGITFCQHRLAFSNYGAEPGEQRYRVAMISLSQPLWPMYAYAFLGPATQPRS